MQTPANSGVADTWIRVQLYNMTKNDKTSKFATFVSGADLAALNAPSSYLGSTQWQVYSTNKPNKFTVGNISGTPSKNGWTLSPTANGTYVAVRVDADGHILSVGEAGTTGYGVHQSCWASFRPTPP